VFELQGELNFMSLEAVSRLITKREPCPEVVLLDLRRVNRVDRSGAEFSSAPRLVPRSTRRAPRVSRALISSSHSYRRRSGSLTSMQHLSGAKRSCCSESEATASRQAIPINLHELLQDLTPGELATAQPSPRSIQRGGRNTGRPSRRAGRPDLPRHKRLAQRPATGRKST